MSDAPKKKAVRPPMPEQAPEIRRRNFDEVPLGYSPEVAIEEAKRCLQCKKPLCAKGCPVEVQIPEFIKCIAEGDFIGAGRKLFEDNGLPAVCGRVCPQETQCEQYCILGKKGDAIAIGRLERFAADYMRENTTETLTKSASTGKRVAVVGSGPAGLMCAADLSKAGHQVTVFEAFHKAGGVLVYGIPEFRLPKAIVQSEVDRLKELGADIELNAVIGKIATIDELLDEDGYDAIFIGTGAGLPNFMGIPGENLGGVYSANEYLTRANLMKAYEWPKYDTPISKSTNVAVIGGGNVAMDSARTALRLGAETVTLVYRRAREQMPARDEEIHHAEEEGIEFHLLNNPVEILGNSDGKACGMRCIKMELGEPDDSGRRRPVEIEGSEYDLKVDTVIVAIGNTPNPLIPATTPDLETGWKNTIAADDETGKTSKDRVYAGGDIVTGAATVIEAMGAGKRAAKSINALLQREIAEEV
jgi:glutamate synthase (NADPH) small chain